MITAISVCGGGGNDSPRPHATESVWDVRHGTRTESGLERGAMSSAVVEPTPPFYPCGNRFQAGGGVRVCAKRVGARVVDERAKRAEVAFCYRHRHRKSRTPPTAYRDKTSRARRDIVIRKLGKIFRFLTVFYFLAFCI